MASSPAFRISNHVRHKPAYNKNSKHRGSLFLFKYWVLFYHTSRIMSKPAFCICKNKGADQLCGYTTDPHLCFPHTDSTIPFFLNPKFQASRHLLKLCSPVCVEPGSLLPGHFLVLDSNSWFAFMVSMPVPDLCSCFPCQFKLLDYVNGFQANSWFGNFQLLDYVNGFQVSSWFCIPVTINASSLF